MKQSSRQQGFALIVALMVMVIIGILATGAIFNAMTSRSVAANDRNNAYAQYMAEAGLNRYKTVALQSYKFMKVNIANYDLPSGSGAECGGGNLLGFGIDLTRTKNGSGKYTIDISANTDYATDVTLPDGTKGGYVVRIGNGGDNLISQGWVGGDDLASSKARSTSAVGFQVGGGNPYDNAIFVEGITAGAPSIKGNVAIYGSVHSIDNNVEIQEPTLELSGTSGIFNNYKGKDGQSNSDITDAVARLKGPSTTNDLCAKIKLKSGSIKLNSGAARLGMASKKLKGIYLGAGASIINGTQGTNVFTETPSMVSLYNSDLDVPMPTLAATYPNDKGYTISAVGSCGWLFQGGKVKLPPADPSTSKTGCGSGDNTIKWIKPASGNPYLEINGIINSGFANIDIDPANNSAVYYKGRGSLRAGGSAADVSRSVKVNGDLIPLDTSSSMGLVSSGTMNVGDDSQVDVAAVLFSKGLFTISKQTTLLGAVVAGKVSIGGNQVPKIAHDPRVGKNPPPGMPGGDSVAAAAQPVINAYERR